MTSSSADELRKRLVEIDDEIRALPADEFARRHELLTESDLSRAALRDEVGPEIEAANKKWAERAGRKGEHEVDYEARKGAVISIATPDAGGAS